MSWTCPGHYKVHVHGWDSPGRPVHRHCPVPLPALPLGSQVIADESDIIKKLPKQLRENFMVGIH